MGGTRRRLLAASLLLTACVSVSWETRADRAWRDGDMEAAAAAYESLLEADPGGAREARALYRLAMIHSLPESPLRDDRRATDLLERLLALYPDSPYAPQAAATLELQRQVTALREMSSELSARLQEIQGETYDAVRGLQEEMGRIQGEAEAKDQRIGQLQNQLSGLRERLATFNDQVARLQEELRRLKEIDLGGPP